MPPDEPGRAWFVDPDGRPVLLDDRTWVHITSAHPEVAALLDRIRDVVEHPTETRPGRYPGESWMYGALRSAPAPGLKVVVRYDIRAPIEC